MMDMPDPYTRDGTCGYRIKSLLIINIVREYYCFSYRRMEAELISCPELLKMIGIRTPPSKSTIARAAKLVKPIYLCRLSRQIVKSIEKKNLIADGSGISTSVYDCWFKAKHVEKAIKKCFRSSTQHKQSKY